MNRKERRSYKPTHAHAHTEGVFHNTTGRFPCGCKDTTVMLKLVVHPKERGTIFHIEPGEHAMNNIIAALCNSGHMTIVNLDAEANELVRTKATNDEDNLYGASLKKNEDKIEN